jgi:uncharacterized protein (DUF433 family)
MRSLKPAEFSGRSCAILTLKDELRAVMTIQELEPKLSRLSRAEKAELVRRLLQEIVNDWPGVDSTPGVAGGEACIVRTRIPVWALENYRRLGLSEAAILENYPSLRAADLVNAWAYTDSHRAEIDAAILKNEQA